MNYQIKNINNQNFKKFGDLISIKEKNYDEINKNTANSFFDLANIQIEGEDKKSRMLENHPYSSQVFLPFLNTTFLVLVAPIAIKPNLDEIEIFRVTDGDGINFNPKVWHFPLISLDNAKYITIDKKDAKTNIEIYNFDKSEIFELNYE